MSEPVQNTDNRLDSNGLLYLFHRIKEIFTGMFQAKEAGKGLSTNDYTTVEKNKLAVAVTGVTMNGAAKSVDQNGVVDLGTVITEATDISGKADKTDTVLNTTLSMGRKANTTVGANSTALGSNVTASGEHSHAEGINTTASGINSHAEGNYTTASGGQAHAEGFSTNASGNFSHAEGNATIAIGADSHAEGISTTTRGEGGHAEGCYTISEGAAMHAAGKANVIPTLYPNWTSNTPYALGDRVMKSGSSFECIEPHTSGYSIDYQYWNQIPFDSNVVMAFGNGTTANRSNALTLEWEGNLRLAKDVYVNANNDGTGGSKLAKEDSPTFSGTPTAPTVTTSDNSTKLANTAFVKNAIAAALDGRAELDFQFLQQLPQSGVKGIFYFIPKSDPATGDEWDEYVWNADDQEFERIGSASIDLTGYYNTTNLPAITNVEIDAILAT